MGKKKQGHYCKICGRYRANEKFSGKGHRQHICKDCKSSNKKAKKSKDTTSIEQWDRLFESDGDFPFESGIAYGTTTDEANHDQAFITVPIEVAGKLRKLHKEKSLEKSIYSAIALTLFVTKQISMERAAYLMDCHFNDFIDLLQTNQIQWNVGEKDGYEEYLSSMDDLLVKVDNFMENKFADRNGKAILMKCKEVDNRV